MEVFEDGIGSAFHFLPKPCPSNRLIQEIQRCLAIEKWLGKKQIKNVVGTLGELPSLPTLYLKIVDALNSDDISVELIGREIAKDLTISAKILKIVNSSYFGFDETISDINQAVSVLGIETVKNLVLAIQVFGDEREGDGQEAYANADDGTTNASSKFDSPSIATESAKLSTAPKVEVTEPKSLKKNATIIALCAAACAAFAVILFKSNTDGDVEAPVDDWESGSLAAKEMVAKDKGTSVSESRFSTITPRELIDEVSLKEFETVTAKELVEESYGPIRFPQIRVTQIYHDLPIPVAQIDRKLVRIGDKASGAELVDINRKNVVLQIDGQQKSYSVK